MILFETQCKVKCRIYLTFHCYVPYVSYVIKLHWSLTLSGCGFEVYFKTVTNHMHENGVKDNLDYMQ